MSRRYIASAFGKSLPGAEDNATRQHDDQHTAPSRQRANTKLNPLHCHVHASKAALQTLGLWVGIGFTGPCLGEVELRQDAI